MRAFVLDDERLAVDRLKRLLAATGRVEIVGSSTDPETALDFLTRNAVDVLFLDIQMPGLTGFELLERLDTHPLVIFTTAYDRYALNAFAVNSIDYLLKPIEPERLDRALDKLERLTRSGGDRAPDLRMLARQLAAELAPARRLERIASRVGERTTVLDVGRISHFTAKDKLTFAHVQGREHEQLYQLAESLIDWDERLTLWRMRHYKVVSRIIGDEVIGTQGTPVELLGGLIKQKFFPELWDARNKLTELANEE